MVFALHGSKKKGVYVSKAVAMSDHVKIVWNPLTHHVAKGSNQPKHEQNDKAWVLEKVPADNTRFASGLLCCAQRSHQDGCNTNKHEIDDTDNAASNY